MTAQWKLANRTLISGKSITGTAATLWMLRKSMDANKNEATSESPLKIKKLPLPFQVFAQGQVADLQELCEEYQEAEFKELMRATTCQGNNPLHLAALHNTADVILELTNILKEDACALAVQANHEGNPPVELFEKNPHHLSDERRDQAALTLFSLTRNPPLPELFVLLDADEIYAKQFSHIKDPRFISNLKATVAAMNEARTAIKKSFVHHAVNAAYSTEKSEEMRKICDEILSMRSLVQAINFFSSRDTPDLVADLAKRKQVANCLEMSSIVYAYFKNNSINASCDMVHLINGDHVFNVVDRAPNADPNRPTKWGEFALVGDALLGKIYLAKDVAENLKEYRNVTYRERKQYYLGPFNRDFHKLRILYEYHPNASLSIERDYLSLLQA